MSLPEYGQIKKTLEDLHLPEELVGSEIELGSDSTAGFAAWITLVIADDVWSEDWLRKTGRDLRHQVTEAVFDTGVASWPYLTLITASDHNDLTSQKSAI